MSTLPTISTEPGTRFVVLDTETTGLSAEQGDRVIELGCVELVDRKPTGHDLHLYFNPERDSHPDALRIHGLTTEFLRDKPKFAEKSTAILDYLRGAHLLIHNAAFDTSFLDAELARLRLPPLRQHVAAITDTLALAKELFPGKRNSLDALCDRLDVDRRGRTLHGALLDARLLADVYINMTRGQHALLTEEPSPNPDTPITLQPLQADPEEHLDLSTVELPIISASTEELAAHSHMLQDLDKASSNKTIWKIFEKPAETAA